MRIAVIADTHNNLRGNLLDQVADASEIWHLGDVCDPVFLRQFEKIDRPLHVVRGNCDYHDWPETLTLKRAGTQFHLVHIPPPTAPAGVDVVLHGHTHVPRNETLGGVRFLNPGCVTRPNRGAPPSFAWLDIQENGEFSWRVVELPR